MAHFVSVRVPGYQVKAGVVNGEEKIFIGRFGQVFKPQNAPYTVQVRGKGITTSFEQHGVVAVVCETDGATERFTMTQRGVCRHDMRADGKGNFSSRGIEGVEIRPYQGKPETFPGTKAM